MAIIFGKVLRKTRFRKFAIRFTIRFFKTGKSIFVQANRFCPRRTVNFEVIALYAWAPHTISGFYIVKSAMRLINSGNLYIKNPYAVWVYARWDHS
jgi:hypothetical protein